MIVKRLDTSMKRIFKSILIMHGQFVSVLRRLDELGLFHTENMELSAVGDDEYVGGSCCEMHLC